MGRKNISRDDVFYFYNLREVENIRKEFLNKHPQFSYGRVYSERRKNGVCRSKFWLVNKNNVTLFKQWMTKNYPWYEVKESTSYWGKPGVAFFVK